MTRPDDGALSEHDVTGLHVLADPADVRAHHGCPADLDARHAPVRPLVLHDGVRALGKTSDSTVNDVVLSLLATSLHR